MKIFIYLSGLFFGLLVLAQGTVSKGAPPARQSQPPMGFATGMNPKGDDGLSLRDPFRMPQYLIGRIKEKTLASKVDTIGIDDSIEAIRRWPLSAYQLVGIIWDVKKPKAMFVDKGNTIHMLHLQDRIGRDGGILTAISSGEVVVFENNTPLKIRLKK